MIEPDDILALAAAIYMFMKLHLSPKQRYPRKLPVAALLTRQLWYSTMRNPSSGSHTSKFRMPEQLGYELAILTPMARMAWVDIFRRRFSLMQQQRRQCDLIRLQSAVPTDCAHQVAADHFQVCALLEAAQLVRARTSSCLLAPLLPAVSLNLPVCSSHLAQLAQLTVVQSG